MNEMIKNKSPFYPGQPVPVELFSGRDALIRRIRQRCVGQTGEGKPTALFVQGEYGIGKSSIAGIVQYLAEAEHSLHGIYATLGGAKTLEDVARCILDASVRSGAFEPNRSERIRNLLARYIGKQELFGVSVNLETIRTDAPQLTAPSSLLDFLRGVLKQLADTEVKGILLILDEINGITSNADFAHFIKGLIDTNALSRTPLPLMLMLCGVEERRREMIDRHPPVDRIFDVVEVEAMTPSEMKEFFRKAFDSVKLMLDDNALDVLTHYSAGFPKIMHIVGDAAYWIDRDSRIDHSDALQAVLLAAEEVGKKYVDQQVYKALRSDDYRSILDRIAKMGPGQMNFTKAEVEKGLNETQRGKLNNFLQKMKKLQVIRSGENRGEYVFNVRMVRLYIFLQSLRASKSSDSSRKAT
ncbi:MAG TPA: ATP-binding protein [Candidatus Hydrogenedentes bacterium]|nr:ATP-binding protein [Candidatus Hydrogenedentota bacterium]HOS02353.1 ATP-binding protein [Candidatus Hydrogenedentota bacterium]